MKNLIYVATMLLFILLSSCEKEEFTYSCNEEEDAWVKENLDDIRTMSRSNWLKVDESMKRAVYSAFTPEQKQIFWKEKLQKVLVDKQWSPEEYNHLQLLKETIDVHIEWFDEKGVEHNEKAYDEFKIFAYEWVEYASNKLKWSELQIAAIAASGKDLKIINGEIVDNWTLEENNKIQTRNEVKSCNCKSSNLVITTCNSLLNLHCRTSSHNTCEEVRSCGLVRM